MSRRTAGVSAITSLPFVKRRVLQASEPFRGVAFISRSCDAAPRFDPRSGTFVYLIDFRYVT